MQKWAIWIYYNSNSFNVIVGDSMKYQVIPNLSINNSKLVGLLENTHYYRKPFNRIRDNGDSWTFEYQYTTTYEILMTNDDIKFFIGFDDRIRDNFTTELNVCWKNATFKETNFAFIGETTKELELAEHYFLSLKTDLRGEWPLSNILETQNMLKYGEMLYIRLELEPESPTWYKEADECIERFKQNGIVTSKSKIDKRVIATKIVNLALEFVYDGIDFINDMISDEKIEHEYPDDARYANLMRSGLSNDTLQKSKYSAYKTKIIISTISNRSEVLFRNILKSFNAMDGDNKFILVNKSNYKNILSSKELAQIMQLPTKDYQRTYKIDNIDAREISIPPDLQVPGIPIGISDVKREKLKAYWCNDYNSMALPKIVAGPQGSGKSKYTENFIVSANKLGHCTVVFDYIKNCELTETASKHTKNNVIIDLSDINNLPSFSYPEISYKLNEFSTPFERIEIASDIAKQVTYLINSVTDENTGPLTGAMVRYLKAAARVVFIHPNETLDNCLRVLEDWKTRGEYIRKTKGIYDYNDRTLNTLRELNDADEDGKIIGTRHHLIAGIINRIDKFQDDPRMSLMLNSKPDKHNFTKYMNEGKAVYIRMPQSMFRDKSTKDVIVTYFMTRIVMACYERSSIDKPNIAHIVVDEVSQIPTAAAFLENHITEFRKFGIAPFFTVHYLKQFKTLLDAVKSSGASYMLLNGLEKENLMALKEEIQPFTIDEAMNLKEWESLNVIRHNNQYSRFISKLPKIL